MARVADTPAIFLTGASGFVGRAVLDAAQGRGHAVHALVHRAALEDRPGVTPFAGGLFDDRALDAAMAGCSVGIHLVGIIDENPRTGVTFERIHVDGTRRVLDAARRAGVKRWIHMSALGARPDAPSAYHRTKFEAEQLVRASSLDWTILRPSMICGPEGQFTRMAIDWARRRRAPWLFMPYFGRGVLGTGGSGRLQPIHVRDVARAFIDAIDNPLTIGQTYDLAGPEVMTWPQLYRLIAEAATGRRCATAGIPIWYAALLARTLPRWALPFNLDQVRMAGEDNTADTGRFVSDFGWSPRPLAPTLGQELAAPGAPEPS